MAAALYEWTWVAVVGGVLLLGLYLQYELRKLSHVAKQLGMTMGDAGVMLRPNRTSVRARNVRALVVAAATSLGGRRRPA
ncbi:MAG: hypothetical protein ACRDV3_04120 [Acidothermaceae bacterium]